MFIERIQHPFIEYDPAVGLDSLTLVQYFSDRADPFKTVLPLLTESASQDEERVLVIASPLSGLLDETIRIHRHPDFVDQVVVDNKQQPFFEAVKAALAEAMAKIDQIHFAVIDDEEDDLRNA